jgi:16S rRNA (adenine(1408)-N(1))-methyltransferase
MESIRGKQALEIDAPALAQRLAGYERILMDIGTGDGRFVQQVAKTCPEQFAIGIDACRENLCASSRNALPNALYIIANAQALPCELYGLATHVTINFPWGSLLNGLLTGDPTLLGGLAAIARPGAILVVRLNGGALAEAGWGLEDGGERVHQRLCVSGFGMRPTVALTARDLRTCPTTWAKRLAFGRDPRALYLRGGTCRAAGTLAPAVSLATKRS